MLLNIDKCKVMHCHFGLNNVKAKYEMNDITIGYSEEVIEERDLRVIQSDLKCGKQSLKAVSTANKV